MKEYPAKITTLQNLFNYDVSKFTGSEIILSKSLAEWIKEASSIQLKNSLQKYSDFVQQHIQKLEAFYEEEKISSLSLANKVMQAFIEETAEKLSNCADAEVKDACLLASIQAINHFKISAYGTAAAFAKALGMNRQAEIFHEAEVNEKHIDDRLSQLAEFEINNKARTPIVLPG
jgi:ferritin-like metal-binding protein YciE